MLTYKFMESDYVRSSIEGKRIKVSTLDKLNDPYELLPHLIDTDGKTISSARCREVYIPLLAKKHGFISLSSTAVDPVLWAHYAGSHTGAAFEFDFPKDALLEVDYLDERVRITILDETFQIPPTEESMLALFKRKFPSWAYECEYRVHVDLDSSTQSADFYFEPIPPHYFRRVILGCDFNDTEESIRKSLDSAGFDHVKIAHASLSDTGFTMDIH